MSREIERIEQVNGKSLRVFPSLVAGQFYPAGKEPLLRAVRSYLNDAASQELPGTPQALVVPHAGYVYSGKVAANGYKCLEQGRYDRAVIIGSNHNGNAPYFKISVGGSDCLDTPLGRMPVMPLATQLIARGAPFRYVPEAHLTHIIEVHLPFLQQTVGAIEVLPLVTGDLTAAELGEIAAVLAAAIDERTLLVISSDLSHFHAYDQAVRLDHHALDTVVRQDLRGLSGIEACGIDALAILLHIARVKGWQAKLLAYCNSGDVSGDRSRVVGYGAVVFYAQGEKS